MRELGRSARRAALFIAAAMTTGCGLVVLFQLVPDHVGVAPTAILLGVVALLMLPGVTLAALELDRRARSHSAHRHGAGPRPESGARHRRPARTARGVRA